MIKIEDYEQFKKLTIRVQEQSDYIRELEDKLDKCNAQIREYEEKFAKDNND